MSTVLSWSELQRALSASFRVVSYDRAGLGWSQAGPMPRSADRIVDELRNLLGRAAIPPPYVLVRHSFGGLTMPLFAARFPDEVAGMVLELRTTLMGCEARDLLDLAAPIAGLTIGAVRDADARECANLQREAFGQPPLAGGEAPQLPGGGSALARVARAPVAAASPL